MSKNTITPPTILLISILIMVLLHLVSPIFIIIPPFWNLTGIILIIFGIIINLKADQSFKKANTTVKPYETPTTFITNGVFSITRNPMYLGFILILIGIWILLRSISPILVVIIFILFVDRMYIKIEENNLEDKFGSTWLTYKKKVRRWL